jgi:hypothetical protein
MISAFWGGRLNKIRGADDFRAWWIDKRPSKGEAQQARTAAGKAFPSVFRYIEVWKTMPARDA